MADAQVKEYPYCFGCGASNPIGLRLRYQADDKCLKTEFIPRDEHQGWPGIVHGGIITSLLYEVLENFPYYEGIIVMMKNMETRFRRPANIGEKIVAKSWLVERSGRNINISATLTTERDELIAEGKAVLVELTQDRIERLGLAS